LAADLTGAALDAGKCDRSITVSRAARVVKMQSKCRLPASGPVGDGMNEFLAHPEIVGTVSAQFKKLLPTEM